MCQNCIFDLMMHYLHYNLFIMDQMIVSNMKEVTNYPMTLVPLGVTELYGSSRLFILLFFPDSTL